MFLIQEPDALNLSKVKIVTAVFKMNCKIFLTNYEDS